MPIAFVPPQDLKGGPRVEFKMNVDEHTLPWPSGGRFVGQPMGTNYYCFDIISNVLARYPHVGSIIELGTYAGTMSMYLGLWGLKLGVPVHTFDHEPNISKDVHHVLDALGVQCHWCDMYSPEGKREIMDCVDGPCYMFVDGGDKQREFAIFAPILPVGSVISVHDWGTEIKVLDGSILQYYLDPGEWNRHDAGLATVVKLGDADEALRNLTDEQLTRLRQQWLDMVNEVGEMPHDGPKVVG